MADARQAAAELGAAGAGQVLLFGSVARGDACDRSDIDLVAVFDDIEYSRRASLQCRLSAAAQDACGHPVEVYVTDRPEWCHRSQKVSASFEAGIASEAVVLLDRPVSTVYWSKEIGMAGDNTAEALGRLDEAAKSLNLMAKSLLPDAMETLALDSDENPYQLWRLIDVCAAGAIAVETSLKTLAAVVGNAVPFKHRIDLLLTLAGSSGPAARAVLAELHDSTLDPGDLPYGDLTVWRQAGTYIADRPEIDIAAVSRLAPLVVRAAVDMTALAATVMVPHDAEAIVTTRAARVADHVAGILQSHDPLTGNPR